MRMTSPEQLFSLHRRVALLTGAAGHLGPSIAGALAGAGAKVYLNGRRAGPLEELRDEIRRGGGDAEIAPLDVLDSSSVADFMVRLASEAGRLDVLVNNANFGRTGTIASCTDQDYSDAFGIAVRAPAELVRSGTDLLRAAAARSGQASVINVASMYGMVSPDPGIYGSTGHDSPPAYGSAKAALLQFTRYAAVHFAPERIRVNSISPGPFPRPELAEAHPEFWAALNQKVPMRRIGEPQELQGAVIFLASDASSFVTGSNLVVDGGWTAW